MSALISPLASVDPSAKLADSVEVGPHCYVGPHVEIGPGTRLLNGVTVRGHARIGRYNVIHSGAVIGGEPQDISYRDEATSVVLGNHNIVRECTTINRGSTKETGATTIGDHCYFMACSHIAHDCQIGSHVIIANGSMLGGHVHVHDFASISGLVAAHHFVTIGNYAFVAGMSRVIQDVPPFMLCEGQPARPRCINMVALKRNNFPADVIEALSRAHRLLYRAKVGLDAAREMLRSEGKMLPQVNQLMDFAQLQCDGRKGRARQLKVAA